MKRGESVVLLDLIKSLSYLFIPIAKAVETENIAPPSKDTMESIEKTSKLISEYGVEIVILAVFIVIFIGILTYMVIINNKLINKTMKDRENEVVSTEEIIEAAVSACVASIKETQSQLIKDSMEQSFEKEKEKHKDMIQTNLNAYAIFEEAAKTVMQQLKCQRIGIYLLHNGNSTPYGYPFAKASCAYEYTPKGPIKTIRGREHSSVPLYAFSKLIEHLMEYDDCLVDSIDEYHFQDEETKEQFADFVAGSRIISLYVLAIRDNAGLVAAFTTIEYDSAEKLHQYTYDEFKQITSIMNAAIKPIIIDRGFVSGYENATNYGSDNEKKEYK